MIPWMGNGRYPDEPKGLGAPSTTGTRQRWPRIEQHFLRVLLIIHPWHSLDAIGDSIYDRRRDWLAYCDRRRLLRRVDGGPFYAYPSALWMGSYWNVGGIYSKRHSRESGLSLGRL